MKKTFMTALLLLASVSTFAQNGELSGYTSKNISALTIADDIFSNLDVEPGRRVRYCTVVETDYEFATLQPNKIPGFTLKLSRAGKIAGLKITRDGKMFTSPTGEHMVVMARSEPTFANGLRTYKELKVEIVYRGYTYKVTDLSVVTIQSNQAGQKRVVANESLSCK